MTVSRPGGRASFRAGILGAVRMIAEPKCVGRHLPSWVRVQSKRIAAVKWWHKEDGVTGVLSVRFHAANGRAANYDIIREARGGSTEEDLREMLNAKSPYTCFRERFTRAKGYLVFGPMYQ